MEEFDRLVERLEEHSVEFIIPPQTRYEGKVGEQETMFFLDMSGNPLEVKAFKDENEVFQ